MDPGLAGIGTGRMFTGGNVAQRFDERCLAGTILAEDQRQREELDRAFVFLFGAEAANARHHQLLQPRHGEPYQWENNENEVIM